ncbi:hypothetical protein CVT26_004773 [Gymnopilus dilepis]|uniref:Uncharacterized protein n=1 Tax=Gymnopilus dilepis TaxID=231916 RepID=A0A409XZD2_9AGAR|nr:hypothetical protein CVT26_004773 [Gymnopilus dilepis]
MNGYKASFERKALDGEHTHCGSLHLRPHTCCSCESMAQLFCPRPWEHRDSFADHAKTPSYSSRRGDSCPALTLRTRRRKMRLTTCSVFLCNSCRSSLFN